MLTPPTARTPPAGTFLTTGVVERVDMNGCVELLSILLVGPALFGHRSPRGTLRIITERLEMDPVPPGTSHKPRHTTPRRCGGLCLRRPFASPHATSNERDATRDEHAARPARTSRARRPAAVAHHTGAAYFFSRPRVRWEALACVCVVR